MKKMIFLVVLFIPGFYTHVAAQASFWDSPNAYLGQTRPGDTPKIFAPGLLAHDSSFAFDRCAFSPDGTEFYYCTNHTWFESKHLQLKAFKYDGKQWKGPSLVNEHHYAPVFSTDGKSLFFIGGGKGGVSKSKRADTGWSVPETFMERNYGLYDFMPTASGNQYAASNIHGSINDYQSYDICLLPSSDKDTVAQSLGIPLNTPGFDGDFFIAKDESYIILSAKEHPDYECEIYISFRKKDNTWTNPKSLGPQINNGLAHRWGEYVTPDNKYLFYSYGHSEKDCALYWVGFDRLLENLKHSNFEPYVRDSIRNQFALKGRSYSFEIPLNTFYDDDGNSTLKYSATSRDGDALPSWLKFDQHTKKFSGTAAVAGTYDITLTATDTEGTTASCRFSLTVKD